MPESQSGNAPKELVELVRHLGGLRGRLVVLYGKRAGGKTQLVRDSLVPLLAGRDPVYFGECSTELPLSLRGPASEMPVDWSAPPAGIVILDGFDGVLALPERPRREATRKLLLWVRAGAENIAVVVVSNDSLPELFALRDSVPEIADNLIELPELSLTRELERLAAAGSDGAWSPDRALLDAVAVDLEHCRNSHVSPELVRAIYTEVQAGSSVEAGQPVGLAEYRNTGCLKGLLTRHLGRRIQRLRDEKDPETAEAAQAVLSAAAVALAEGRVPDFGEIPARLDISPEAIDSAIDWLQTAPALLRAVPDGTFDIRPVQLAEALQDQAELEQREFAGAYRVLAQGVQAWQELGTTLPKESFLILHRIRKRLRVSGAQAALLVHCALRHSDAEDLKACRYWIERIPEKPERAVTLVRGLFASRAGVRIRAARLLAGYDEPEVRYQLFRIALEDTDASARRAAVDSLECLQVEELREQLEQEAADPEDPYRQNAVEALRISHDQRSTAFLQRLVNEPGVDLPIRAAAISTLAATDAPDAVEALVSIALEDPDLEDRQAAASALGTVTSEILQARALERIRQASLARTPHAPAWTPVKLLASGARLLLAIALTIATVPLHGLALLFLRRPRTAAVFFCSEAFGWLAVWRGYEGLGVTLLFFNLLAALLVSFRAAPASRWRSGPTLAKVLLVANIPAFILLHGLAHLLLKRVRRAFEWFGVEILGVVCLLIVVAFPDLFKPAMLPQPEVLNWIERNLPNGLRWFYIVGFAGCFVISFLGDVLGAGRLLCRSRSKLEAEARRECAYREMIGTPQGASVVLSAVGESNAERARWASRLVRRYERTVPRESLLACLTRDGASTPAPVLRALERMKNEQVLRDLSTLWGTAEPPLRRRILNIMANRPSEASLHYLRGLLPEAGGTWWPLRYGISFFLHWVHLLPVALRLTGTFALPVALLLFYEGIATAQNGARPLLNSIDRIIGEVVVSRASASPAATRQPAFQGISEKERHVTEAASFLARRYPKDSAARLVKTFRYLQDLPVKPQSEEEREALTASLRALRRALTRSLVILAAAGDPDARSSATEALSKALRWPSDERLWLENVETLSQIARSENERGRFLPFARSANERGGLPYARSPQDVARDILSAGAGRLGDALASQVDLARKQAVLEALTSAPSSEAVGALKRFVISPPGAADVRDRPQLEQVARAEELIKLQASALVSLRRMGTSEARKALSEIAESDISADLRRQARGHYDGALSAAIAEARTSLERGEYAQAVAAGSDVLPEVPESPARSDLLLILGQASHLWAASAGDENAAQQEDKAIDYLEQSRDSRAVRLLALSRAGKSRLLLRAQDLKGALEQARLGLKTDPQCAEAAGAEGAAMLQMGDRRGALRAFAKATEISPGYMWAYFMQAQILSAEKDYTGAENIALRAVESYPSAPWTYSLLRQIYLDQNRLTDLIGLLEQLSAKYSPVPYPRQHLAYLQHERISLTDPDGYRRAYDINKRLLGEIDKSRDSAGRFSAEANFAENNLTTGRYREAVRLAESLYGTPEYEIPMRLIGYAALVAQGDYSAAAGRLNELEEGVRSLPPDAPSTWVFDGTLNYLRNAALPQPSKSALIKLVAAFNQRRYGEVPVALFDENRAALR